MKSIVLFCGMGGTTEGMVRAGLDVRAAVDKWPIACEAHRRWHPEIETFQVACENADQLIDDNFAFAWASPSCKPWSMANRRRRGPNHPEYYPLSLLLNQTFGSWRARWLVIENVCGLLWTEDGRAELARFSEAMKRWPGLVWNYSLVRACDHGVPQLRRRVIIVVGPHLVTIPDGISPIEADAGGMVDTATPSPGRDRSAQRAGPRVVSAVDASPPSRGVRSVRAAAVCGNRAGSPVAVARQRARLTQSVGGPSRERARRVEQAVIADRAGCGSWRRHAQHSVMGPHGTTHDPRSGEANYHEARTLAECAELQCLPMAPLDGFTKTAAHALVGNAVPPPVAEWVCRTVMRADEAFRSEWSAAE